VLRYVNGTPYLYGWPMGLSSQVPKTLTTGTSTDTSYVVFADFTEAYVGTEHDLTIDTSTEAAYSPDNGVTFISAYQAQQVLFRASMTLDFAHRRAADGWVAVLRGVRP